MIRWPGKRLITRILSNPVNTLVHAEAFGHFGANGFVTPAAGERIRLVADVVHIGRDRRTVGDDTGIDMKLLRLFT